MLTKEVKMAMLVLSSEEDINNLIVVIGGQNGMNNTEGVIRLSDFNVILKKSGRDTEILKGPFKNL